MRINQKVLSLFFLLIFSLNVISYSIVVALDENQTPATVNLTTLRGEPGVYSPKKSPLFENSNGISATTSTELNSSSYIALHQTPIRYAIEDGVDDDVDSNTSDVDSSSDIGIETNFDYAQGISIDSQFMQVQEELGSAPTVQIDSISTNNDSSNYFVHNHTVTGTNCLLVVTVQTNGGTRVFNVTFGGELLDLEANITRTGKGSPTIEVWSLLDPSIGTAEVEIYLLSSDRATIGVISYTGVDQTTPIDGVTVNEGFTRSPTITVPSRIDDWVQDAMASLSSGIPAPESGQTVRWSEEMGGTGASSHYGVGSTTDGNTSVTTEWSINVNKDWVMIGINIRRANPANVLDLEYQWTNAEYTKLERELAIYTGTLGTENLKVDVWSGSSTWVTIIDSLVENDWNNISVVPYMTSSTFTIRLTGANEVTDDSSDFWNIDLMLLVTSPENNLPIAENLTLTPDPLYGNDTLNLDYDYTDQDGDLESGTEILWYKWNITDSVWNLI
ncbi:MAG: hypothetical protein KAT16_04015 [Candidatus Heimdallarchaeota archaeon]|nr:hypothetical protein [Candidatus Heimdallarchaeota archaeon]